MNTASAYKTSHRRAAMLLAALACSSGALAQNNKAKTAAPAPPARQAVQRPPVVTGQRPAAGAPRSMAQPGTVPQQRSDGQSGIGTLPPNAVRQYGGVQQQYGAGRSGVASASGTPAYGGVRTYGSATARPAFGAPPVPSGQRQRLPNGQTRVTTADGRSFSVGPDNVTHSFSSPDGTAARWDQSGRMSMAQYSHGGANTVVRNTGGVHMVETTRPNGMRVVSYGPRSGFVQQPIPGRANFYSRTVVSNGVTRTAVYHSYQSPIDHQTYYRYVPTALYRPAFYAWAGRPWPSVSYGWGAPAWGGVYGAYFAPYSVYTSASLWLTDYLLYTSLQNAYAERQGAAYSAEGGADPNTPASPGAYYSIPNGGYSVPTSGYGQQANAAPAPAAAGSVLDPDVKAQLAQQNGAYIAHLQQVSAAVSPSDTSALEASTPGALDPNTTEFLITTDTTLQVSDSQTCALTPGDVLFRKSTQEDSTGHLAVMVVGTKAGDCQMNTAATMTTAELDEINNQYLEQMNVGFTAIAKRDGKLPISPPPGSTSTMQLASVQPDLSAGSMVAENEQNGQQAQLEASREAGVAEPR